MIQDAIGKHTHGFPPPIHTPYRMTSHPSEDRGNWFIDDSRRLRLGWRVTLFLLACFVIQIAVQIVAVIGVLIYLSVTDPAALQGEASAVALEERLNEMMLELMALVSVPSVICTMGLIWLFRRFLDRRPLADLGFQRPEIGWLRSMVLGLGVGAFPMVVVTGILWSLGALDYSGWTIGAVTLAVLVPGLVFAAFFEEIVCRAYLLGNFRESRLPWIGIGVNSVLFWLFHSLNPSAWQSPLVGINLVLAGVLLSLAYLAANDIWFPTIVHFAWNFAQGPLLGIPVSGIQIGGMFDFEPNGQVPTWLSGGKFGYEASFLCTGLQLMMCVALFFVWRRRIRTEPGQRRASTTNQDSLD